MSDRLQHSLALIEEGIEQGLHPGAQLCVILGGETVADAGLGDARPGVPMTPNHLTLWMSSCKPITAVAVARLVERRVVNLDDFVYFFIPEFHSGGKDRITLRHLLTHTAGLRAEDDRVRSLAPEEAMRVLVDAPLAPGWEPGERAGYHVATSWFILGEIIRRVVGQDVGSYVREEVLLPLGLRDSWIGVPVEEQAGYGDRLAWMFDTGGGAAQPDAFYNSAEGMAHVRPGGNGRGPARELARFYACLLAGGAWNGARILNPETVSAFTGRSRRNMVDQTFGVKMDWGLGFVPDNKRHGPHIPYGYGPHASDRAYGHGGSQSSLAFADPAHGLAVAAVFNGMPGEPRHQRRMLRLCKAIYEDLSLVPTGNPN